MTKEIAMSLKVKQENLVNPLKVKTSRLEAREEFINYL